MNPKEFLQEIGFNFIGKDASHQCQCYSDNCIIRKIKFYNFFSHESVEFEICNNVFRLAIQNLDGWHWRGEYFCRNDKDAIQCLLKEMIIMYHENLYGINIFEEVDINKKSILSCYVYKDVMYRPLIYMKVRIDILFQLFIENKIYLSDEFKKQIKYSLENFVTNIQAKKYQKTLEKVNRAINKLNDRNTRDFTINEILQELLDYQIINT